MKRLRLLLLPLAAVLELLVLVACWLVAFISPRKAKPMAGFAERILPNFSWYMGKTTSRGN